MYLVVEVGLQDLEDEADLEIGPLLPAVLPERLATPLGGLSWSRFSKPGISLPSIPPPLFCLLRALDIRVYLIFFFPQIFLFPMTIVVFKFARSKPSLYLH